MSAYYANYANSDPSTSKLAKVDREGRPYQQATFNLGPVEFELTKTLVPGVDTNTIPAAAILGGFVQITGAAGAIAMKLPSMASTPAITDFIQLIVSQGKFYDLQSVSNSTSGASATGPVRGFKFILSNQNNGTVTIQAPGDASITIVGSATLATLQSHECIIYAVRDNTGALTYNFLKLGGV